MGAFCQSSCYVPINKIKDWSWESYWIVQGVFAWLILPFIGAMLAVPSGHSFFELFDGYGFEVMMTMLFGMLWGSGRSYFRTLHALLGSGIRTEHCLRYMCWLGHHHGSRVAQHLLPRDGCLVFAHLQRNSRVAVTLLGIAIIGVAGSMKASSLSEEEKKAAVKDFNFPKGLTIALLAGFMSGCFNVGLAFGSDIHFGTFTPDMYKTLPATFPVTVGGFITNAIYCFYQNSKNHTWGDYLKREVWNNNILFCALAGALWYSQFFGLSLGKGFLNESPTLMTLSFCILMALNVVFSNVWGIILKEWKGCSPKTIAVLILGIVVLIISSFLPQWV